jgi:membrane protein involved in colicin uptake
MNLRQRERQGQHPGTPDAPKQRRSSAQVHAEKEEKAVAKATEKAEKDAAKVRRKKLMDAMRAAQEELDKIDNVGPMSKKATVSKNSRTKTGGAAHQGHKGSKSVGTKVSIIDNLISPEEAAELEDNPVSCISSFVHVVFASLTNSYRTSMARLFLNK